MRSLIYFFKLTLNNAKSQGISMATRSYVKIYGPPILKAIKALENTSVNIPQVCVMDAMIALGGPEFNTQTGIMDYFGGGLQTGQGKITKERCNSIISKSGEMLGEYDFFFEWFKEPTTKDVDTLITKIDEVLAPIGVKYTITTKK